MGNYHLSRGETGREQRQTLNQLVNPTTQQFLLQAGLRPGMKVLDVGCGMGLMSAWIAEQVGEAGQVVAIDNSAEQLAIAREIASERGLKNIKFRLLAAEAIHTLGDVFDLIYCRFLLIHLEYPQRVLEKIKDCLKVNGIFAVESAILGNEFCHPKSSAFNQWRELNHDIFLALNKDPKTGMKLSAVLVSLGFKINSIKLFQPVLMPGLMRRQLLIDDLAMQAPAMIKAGLIDEDEMHELKVDLEDLVHDPASFIAYCQSCQIAAMK